MGTYTADGLVKHAKKVLGLKTKYMWGGILRPVERQYEMLFKMYGNKPGTGYSAARWNELNELRGKGYYGVDCVGLIKSYYWSGRPDGGVGSPRYGAAGFPDVNAGFMYQQAKVKGKIADMPERPGLIVYSKSHPHVGIYIGNGETIESTLGLRGDGVVKRKLDSLWEYWFECPYIAYPANTGGSLKHEPYRTGDKVRIKSSAKRYPGTNITIPASVKNGTYTIAKLMSGRVLLAELYSWVNASDVTKV